jgi:hypothetical protein
MKRYRKRTVSTSNCDGRASLDLIASPVGWIAAVVCIGVGLLIARFRECGEAHHLRDARQIRSLCRSLSRTPRNRLRLHPYRLARLTADYLRSVPLNDDLIRAVRLEG